MNYHDISPTDLLVAIALESAELAPVEKRIAIYRAGAATSEDKDLATALRAEADALERAQHKCRQLVLRFCAAAETSGRA